MTDFEIGPFATRSRLCLHRSPSLSDLHRLCIRDHQHVVFFRDAKLSQTAASAATSRATPAMPSRMLRCRRLVGGMAVRADGFLFCMVLDGGRSTAGQNGHHMFEVDSATFGGSAISEAP
mmetsp:Transcript_71544/g.232537  ORF Transcript_71544/g.232537 Transcript_71544/m.232537 type:complete len:120 (+) Transcript_71544:278-637(+)